MWSPRPRLDPAITSTRSASAADRLISAASASGSSGCTALTAGRAPACRHRAASMSELVSVKSPGRSAAPTGLISSPVGMIATAGRRATASVACPPAAAAARSAGRSRRPAGTRSSPAAKSSAAARTFLPRGARSPPARPVTRTPPSSRGTTRSRIDHGVGARRHRVAGVDPLERAPRQHHLITGIRRHGAGRGSGYNSGGDHGGGHRDAVHRGAVRPRQRPARVHRGSRDAAEALGRRHVLRGWRGPPSGPRQRVRPPRVGELGGWPVTRATSVAHA